jgi:site-specific recombinase XerD
MPTVAHLLVARRELQAEERAAAPRWETVTYQGERIHLTFTTPTGGLVLRQAVAKLVKQAAKTAEITAQLATHTGRRSVITTLYVDGGEALEDIAQFVGHAKASTTAGYVKRLGRRPKSDPDRAAALLDGDRLAQKPDC